MSFTIHLPNLPIAILITVGAIVLLGCIFRFVANHYFTRGWWACRQRHVHFDLQHDRESRQRI